MSDPPDCIDCFVEQLAEDFENLSKGFLLMIVAALGTIVVMAMYIKNNIAGPTSSGSVAGIPHAASRSSLRQAASLREMQSKSPSMAVRPSQRSRKGAPIAGYGWDQQRNVDLDYEPKGSRIAIKYRQTQGETDYSSSDNDEANLSQPETDIIKTDDEQTSSGEASKIKQRADIIKTNGEQTSGGEARKIKRRADIVIKTNDEQTPGGQASKIKQRRAGIFRNRGLKGKQKGGKEVKLSAADKKKKKKKDSVLIKADIRDDCFCPRDMVQKPKGEANGSAHSLKVEVVEKTSSEKIIRELALSSSFKGSNTEEEDFEQCKRCPRLTIESDRIPCCLPDYMRMSNPCNNQARMTRSTCSCTGPCGHKR